MNYSFSSISHIHHHKPEQRDVIQKKNAEARPTIQLKKNFKGIKGLAENLLGRKAAILKRKCLTKWSFRLILHFPQFNPKPQTFTDEPGLLCSGQQSVLPTPGSSEGQPYSSPPLSLGPRGKG